MSTVSVIIPCYNHQRYIDEALTSVYQQASAIGFNRVEVIIVNDGSTDASEAVIEAFLKSHKSLRATYLLQENQGPGPARNTGLQAATGDYIVFLDADDTLAENQLAIQLTFMEEHPDVSIGYGGGLYHGNNEEIAKRSTLVAENISDTTNVLETLFTKGNFIFIHSAIFTSKIVSRDGVLFDRAFRVLEDWDFWIQCAKLNHTFCPIPNFNVPYRIHEQNSSSAVYLMTKCRVAVLEKHLSYTSSERYQNHIKSLLLQSTISLAARTLAHHKKAAALDIIRKSKIQGVQKIILTTLQLLILITPINLSSKLVQQSLHETA
jgi:glycosyltransferase involved in cell wall biosynthesis